MQTPAESFLTPFYPIMHALNYADRHAQLIADVLQNYDFLG